MTDTIITIYSTTWCAFCHAAKQYLDKLDIPYIDKDVEHNPAAAMEAFTKSDQRAIPVIDIGGTIIIGFDRPKIDDALKAQNLTKT